MNDYVFQNFAVLDTECIDISREGLVGKVIFIVMGAEGKMEWIKKET